MVETTKSTKQLFISLVIVEVVSLIFVHHSPMSATVQASTYVLLRGLNSILEPEVKKIFLFKKQKLAKCMKGSRKQY